MSHRSRKQIIIKDALAAIRGGSQQEQERRQEWEQEEEHLRRASRETANRLFREREERNHHIQHLRHLQSIVKQREERGYAFSDALNRWAKATPAWEEMELKMLRLKIEGAVRLVERYRLNGESYQELDDWRDRAVQMTPFLSRLAAEARLREVDSILLRHSPTQQPKRDDEERIKRQRERDYGMDRGR